MDENSIIVADGGDFVGTAIRSQDLKLMDLCLSQPVPCAATVATK